MGRRFASKCLSFIFSSDHITLLCVWFSVQLQPWLWILCYCLLTAICSVKTWLTVGLVHLPLKSHRSLSFPNNLSNMNYPSECRKLFWLVDDFFNCLTFEVLIGQLRYRNQFWGHLRDSFTAAPGPAKKPQGCGSDVGAPISRRFRKTLFPKVPKYFWKFKL